MTLDVPGANNSNGSLLQLWSFTQDGVNLAQRWRFLDATSPREKLDRLADDHRDDLKNGTKAQRWSFSEAKTLRMRIDELAAAHKSDVAEGTYEIASTAKDSMRFDVVGASRDDGANVQLYGSNGTKAQRWKVTIDAKGYATLKNVASGKVLDISGASKANGANVQQYGSNGSWAQKWILKKNANGSITLISALRENFVIDAAAGGTTNGTNIQMWSSNGSAAQRWTFVKK